MPHSKDLPPEYHTWSREAARVADIKDLLSTVPGVPPDAIEYLEKARRRLQDHAGSFLPTVNAKLGAI